MVDFGNFTNIVDIIANENDPVISNNRAVVSTTVSGNPQTSSSTNNSINTIRINSTVISSQNSSNNSTNSSYSDKPNESKNSLSTQNTTTSSALGIENTDDINETLQRQRQSREQEQIVRSAKGPSTTRTGGNDEIINKEIDILFQIIAILSVVTMAIVTKTNKNYTDKKLKK